jgi:hypothetical protein
VSARARGFIRNERFGAGQVIPGRNCDTLRKWRDLGVKEAAGFAEPSTCAVCDAAICNCRWCVAFKGDRRCQTHRETA